LVVAFGDPASLVAEQPFALRRRRGQGLFHLVGECYVEFGELSVVADQSL
jgi:hypothetical protein